MRRACGAAYLALAIWPMAGLAQGATPESEAAKQKLAARAESIRDVRFALNLETGLAFGLAASSKLSCTVAYKAPGNWRVRGELVAGKTSRPFVTVANGVFLWQHFPAEGQCKRMDIPTVTKGATPEARSRWLDQLALSIFKGGVRDPFALFTDRNAVVTGEGEAAGARCLIFLVKRKASQMTAAVSVEDGILRTARVTDLDGKATHLELRITDVVVNRGIDDASFQFTPPPDARVIDWTEAARQVFLAVHGD